MHIKKQHITCSEIPYDSKTLCTNRSNRIIAESHEKNTFIDTGEGGSETISFRSSRPAGEPGEEKKELLAQLGLQAAPG